MSDRTENMNHRLLIGRLKKLQRTLDEMKALQYMSNLSGVTYYEVSSSLQYDAMVEVPHVVGMFGQVVNFAVVFTADRQEWPFAVSTPRIFVGDSSDFNAAQEVERAESDTGKPHIDMLGTRYKLKFEHFTLVEPAPGRTKYVFIKNSITATDKGSFTTEGRRE